MRIENMIQSFRVLAKAALRATAFCISVFGLVMIGIAVFFTLQDLWGATWAAAVVGLGSLVFSGLLVVFSSYRRPRNDLQIAYDMHKLALDSLVEEARLAGRDVTNVRGLLRTATEGTLIGAIIPLASLLLRYLKRSDGGKPQDR
jgi:hypothetical protein